MANLIFFALPLVIYVSLATLPKGRPALMGIAAAFLLLAALQLAVPTAGAATYLALAGVGMAAIAQALRTALGQRMPDKLYLALLGALPLLALMILSFSVGV